MRLAIPSDPNLELNRTAECEGIPDSTCFAAQAPRSLRGIALVLAALAGLALAAWGKSQWGGASALLWLLAPLLLAGGLLSTWSPCGYSSLSLLRPVGRYRLTSVLGWLPTLGWHALGYALGALLLGGLLGLAGQWLLPDISLRTAGWLLGAAALAYGLHQLDFLRMPYPQRRAQVPHDARNRFPMWSIGLLYGFALGLNYLTYVQTPILYIATGAALFSGEPLWAVALIGVFNLGRCLPMLVNLLPVSDRAVQGWMVRHQEHAVLADGALLVAAGVAALYLCF